MICTQAHIYLPAERKEYAEENYFILLSPSPLFPFPPTHTHTHTLFLSFSFSPSLCISWKKLTLISYLNDTPGHDCHVKYDIITESTRNSTKYSVWTNMCRRAKLDTLTYVYNNVYVTYIADSKLRVVKTPSPYRIQRTNLQCATRLLSKIVSNVILIHSLSLSLFVTSRVKIKVESREIVVDVHCLENKNISKS